MDKKYFLPTKHGQVEVSEQVYRTFYKYREHERYLIKKALKNEYSFEGMIEKGINIELHENFTTRSPEEILLKEIEICAVREAISKLSEEEQQIITLYYYEGITGREIAEYTGISYVTVYKKLKKALEKIKKMFF